MQLLNDMEQLGSVEDGLLGIEQTNHSDCIKKLYSIDEFGQKVDVPTVLV